MRHRLRILQTRLHRLRCAANDLTGEQVIEDAGPVALAAQDFRRGKIRHRRIVLMEHMHGHMVRHRAGGLRQRFAKGIVRCV